MTQLLLHDNMLGTRRWRDEQNFYLSIDDYLLLLSIIYFRKKWHWCYSQLVVYLFIILQKIKSGSSTLQWTLEQSTPPSTGLSSSGSSPQSGERWAGRHCQRQDTADIRSVLVNILFIKLSLTMWLFCCMLSWAVLFNHICLHCISSW